MARKCLDKHPTPVPDSCSICRQFTPGHRNGKRDQPANKAPCSHLGEPTGEVRECKTCSGKVTLKVLACDVRGKCTVAKPIDGIACCKTCTPEQGKLQPEEETLEVPLSIADLRSAPKSRILVPPLPTLDLQPRSKRAVVTVVVGDESRACHEVSRAGQLEYANRIGADYVVLTWPGHPDWPMSCKFAIAQTLLSYERILAIDADVLLPPGCIDPFDMCGPDEIGMCDELAHHFANPQFGRVKQIKANYEALGFPFANKPLPWALNAGVIVASAEHRPLLLPPAFPMPANHCAEQDWINGQILAAVQAGQAKLRILDPRCNWQSWQRTFLAAPKDAILHFSGSGAGRESRAERMKMAVKSAVTFSLILPTISRPTLARALLSLKDQDWRPVDEVIVCGDGPQPVAAAFVRQFGPPFRYLETPTRLEKWGYGVRNWLADNNHANGTHLIYLDDDDAYRPEAVALIRSAVEAIPDRPHVFRMQDMTDGMIRWKTRDVIHGNIGTPMLVVPNDPCRRGRWGDSYSGDLDFAIETFSLYPPAVWHEEVICSVWPAKDIPR